MSVAVSVYHQYQLTNYNWYLAACAAGLVCLELGDGAEAGSDRRADGGGMSPSVRDFIVALVGVGDATEARLIPRGVEQ